MKSPLLAGVDVSLVCRGLLLSGIVAWVLAASGLVPIRIVIPT